MRTAWSAARTWRMPASTSLKTATDSMPISRQARIRRSAISPRLAMRMRRNGRPSLRKDAISSERDVAVFLGRIAIAFRGQQLERADDARAGGAGGGGGGGARATR